MKGDPVSIEFPKHVCGQFDSVITPLSSHFVKPTLLYPLIEHLVPNGSKLELFSTFCTLRSFWTSGLLDQFPKFLRGIFDHAIYFPCIPCYFQSLCDEAFVNTISSEEGECRDEVIQYNSCT